MKVRFIGGPLDGERREIDSCRRYYVPLPLTRPPILTAEGLDLGELRCAVYVYAMLRHSEPVEGAERRVVVDEERGVHQAFWIERVMAEERFYRAELIAQETQERRDKLRTEVFRRFADTSGWRHRPASELVGKGEPDLYAFVRRNYLRATVWRCFDDCDCSQARIEGWDYAYDLDGNACEWPQPGVLAFPRFRDEDGRHGMLDLVWAGRFLTDGEPGAADDLVVISEYLKEFASDIAARISWPWARRDG